MVSFAAMVLIFITFLLFTFYAGVIFFYNRSWKQMPEFLPVQKSRAISFSIIVPARNEEANIGKLLQSIQKQTYPPGLFEVIVVDDHSGDKTADVVRSFGEVRLISLQTNVTNSYKKKAISTGIEAAQNDWIVCTDADCVAPEKWLENFAAIITEKDSVFVAAPVTLASTTLSQQKHSTPLSPGRGSAALVGNEEKAVIERGGNRLVYIFQSLDFLTLQGITAASVFKNVHSMCNGANLAYRKDIFHEVGGFKGIDNIASGDDMLLMHKIWKKYPQKVHYLKSKTSIVETLAAPNWNQFFNQRIRWASKATSYDDKRIFKVLLLVYLFNFSFLVLLIASLFDFRYFIALLIAWVAKTIVEFPFMANVSGFFGKRSLLKYFFFIQPLHIGYTIIAGFLGSVGTYEWKGRRVK